MYWRQKAFISFIHLTNIMNSIVKMNVVNLRNIFFIIFKRLINLRKSEYVNVQHFKILIDSRYVIFDRMFDNTKNTVKYSFEQIFHWLQIFLVFEFFQNYINTFRINLHHSIIRLHWLSVCESLTFFWTNLNCCSHIKNIFHVLLFQSVSRSSAAIWFDKMQSLQMRFKLFIYKSLMHMRMMLSIVFFEIFNRSIRSNTMQDVTNIKLRNRSNKVTNFSHICTFFVRTT